MANNSSFDEKLKAKIAKDVAKQEKEAAKSAQKAAKATEKAAKDASKAQKKQADERKKIEADEHKAKKQSANDFKQSIIAMRAGGSMAERLAIALYNAASANKRLNIDSKIVSNTMGGTTEQAREMLQTFDTMDARVGLPEGFSRENFDRLQQNLGATAEQAKNATDKFRQLAQEGNMPGGAKAAMAYADGVLSLNEAFMKNKNIMITGRQAIMEYMGGNIHATEAVIRAMNELHVTTLNVKNANDVFNRAYLDNAKVRLADEAAEDKALRHLTNTMSGIWDTVAGGARDALVSYDAYIDVIALAAIKQQDSDTILKNHWENVTQSASNMGTLMISELEKMSQKMPAESKKVADAIVAGFNQHLPAEMSKSFSNASDLALQAMKNTLGIHSPSKEAAWIGKMVIAGMDNELKIGVESMGDRMAAIIPRGNGGSSTSTSLTQNISVNANTQVNEAASGAEIGETFTASLDQSISQVFRRAAMAMGVS